MRFRTTDHANLRCATGGSSASAGIDVARTLADKLPVAHEPVASKLQSMRRAGISLLEVLISIFVLVVGILGLAALIPIGRFEVQEAGKLDRAATSGKQAYREMRLRGLLDARNEWLWFDESAKTFKSVLDPNTMQFRLDFTTKGYAPPFAIDPLMFADPRNYDAVWGAPPPDTPSPHTFPYNIVNDATIVGLSNFPQIPRLSLNQLMPISGGAPDYDGWTEDQQKLSAALCNRVFQSRDDLSFFLPDDRDNRPVQQFSIDAVGTNSNDFILQTPAKRLAPMTLGEYSWMVTVSPTVGELYDWTTMTYVPERMRTFVVSVVVFHKRPISLLPNDPTANDPPAERTVAVEFTGSGVGGGSVHLESDAPNYLRDLRPNQWILVTGRINVPSLPLNQMPAVAKWYRIVTVDDGSRPDHRDVTLDGPDWNPGHFAVLGSDVGDEGEDIHAAASIFDGVVAVYDKTMQLDLTGR